MDYHFHSAGRFFIIGIFLILAVIVGDQYSKWFIIEATLRSGHEMMPFKDWFFSIQTIPIFEDLRESYKSISATSFLNIVMVWNSGISFGLFQGGSVLATQALIGLAGIVSIGLIIWMSLSTHIIQSIGMGLIAGGAIANAIDRIRFGAVADFLDFHYNGLHWPAFNVADMCIVIGAMFFIYDTLFHGDKKVTLEA